MRVCDISKQPGVDDRIVILNVPLDFHGTIVLSEKPATFEPDSGFDIAIEMHDFEVSAEVMKAFEAKDWTKLHELTPRDERPKSSTRRSEGARKAAETRRRNRVYAEAEAADAALERATAGGNG